MKKREEATLLSFELNYIFNNLMWINEYCEPATLDKQLLVNDSSVTFKGNRNIDMI